MLNCIVITQLKLNNKNIFTPTTNKKFTYKVVKHLAVHRLKVIHVTFKQWILHARSSDATRTTLRASAHMSYDTFL